MSEQTVIIAQSATASSPCFIPLANRDVAVLVPSLAPPSAVFWEASVSSGSAVFVSLGRSDGTGLAFTVAASGSSPSWCIMRLVSPWGRIVCASGQYQNADRTFTILTLTR